MMSLPLYLSDATNCEYLADQKSRLLCASPECEMSSAIYAQLIAKGFRRSGELVYRPGCDNCSACIPLRIPVSDFRPSRAQRRALTKNVDLHIQQVGPALNDEIFGLYSRYLKTRHGGGSMACSTPSDFVSFLTSSWSNTQFVEYRVSGKLVCVAVTDFLNNALSSVYCFFDPDFQHRGLGTYSILWQIQAAQRLNLKWLYLGYWINQCQKMAYKNRFRPLEGYHNGTWHRFEKGQNMVSLIDYGFHQ